MNPNNPNHGNFNFPSYPNSQSNSNVGPFDPNILNNPQFQAALQSFGHQPRPTNQSYTPLNQNVLLFTPFQQSFNQYPSSFPVFDHLTQQMEQSLRGEDSYNGTLTSGMRKTRHLEEIHEEDVEVVP